MSTKLKSFEFKKTERIYPWHKWTDLGIWQATRGVDFKNTVGGFRTTLFNAARRRSLKVRIAVGDVDVVTFQFYKPE